MTMEKKKFSSDELYLLRNEIPLTVLIQQGLNIESYSRHGRFCFQCPLCQEFNTTVNPKTNLAKCFSCQKMFNTIDLVMKVRHLDFVDSVRFLRNIYGSISTGKKPQDCISTTKRGGHDRFTEQAHQEGAPHDLVHIGQILDDALKSAEAGFTANQKVLTSNSSLRKNPEDQIRNARILDLERKVNHLSLQIKKIIKSIDQNSHSS